MKKYAVVFAYLLAACSPSAENGHPNKESQSSSELPLVGTWELLSAKTIRNDSTTTNLLEGQRMIKIINDTHFAFMKHDLNKGQDSTTAAYVAGGGTYELKGDQYHEHLEYLNYREWEGNDFHFTIEIKGDTLIQSGIEKIEDLGVDQKIIETYKRVTK